MQFERRSLELTAEQWQSLDQLAAQFGATAPTGPAAGQPSWRTLIKQIAGREIELLTAPQPDGEPN